MSDGFTKLFGSLIHSTIWQEKDHTRLVWITMLAMANRNGEVMASIPGLGVAAKVTLEQCEDALKTLSSPDKYSRSKAYDGRRIAEIDGGWVLLNYEEYRKRMSEIDQREKAAERQQRFRDNHASRPVTHRNVSSRSVASGNASNDIAEADAEAKAEIGESPQTPTRKKSRARRSPGRQGGETPLPESFQPTPEHLARCKRDQLDCARELEKFKNRAEANGLLYVNWNAAFTTWLMNAVDFRARNGKSPVEQPKEAGTWWHDGEDMPS